jgi:hypothetical protein
MRFFFPDSGDQVDPTFDFITEEPDRFVIQRRDARYAHEVLSLPPYNGLLVSKAVVDGHGAGGYTAAQRHRLYREGARQFFRLERQNRRFEIMGDCGAWSYLTDEHPPYAVDEIIDFYDRCGVDHGVAIDHAIFHHQPDSGREDDPAAMWVRRQDITLALAEEFWSRCRKVRFTPIGVAQGWSPQSYATAVATLQRIGYRRIAVGGLGPLKTHDLVACLRAIDQVRESTVQLHLLGISRWDAAARLARYGVTSFDSASPFRQAYMDDARNYHTLDRAYAAVRVPRVETSPRVKICGEKAMALERTVLTRLRNYDADKIDSAAVMDALAEYGALFGDRIDRSKQYRATLEDRPWRACSCDLCTDLGIEIVILRGSERNKRRGFHNLHILQQRLRSATGR